MHPYTHVRTEDGRESLTVFTPSGPPIAANGDHPHFAKLLEGAQSDVPADELRGLADLSNAVAQHFDTLSERVAVANGRVYFDGDEVDSTVTRQIIRCLEDPSVGDWKPLVLFMENVAANPNEHSREQLFDWLRDRDFTITTDGCFIAYKGVHGRDEDDGYPYQSSSRGEAIVNGERFTGAIPNGVGATVEMPRSDVQHNPAAGCSTGLHVGTYNYAQGYARAALLTVHVNPRDVVSVPTDCNAEKMRVCRYTVSDDEPTPPEESAAIAYDGEDVDGGPELYELDASNTHSSYADRFGTYAPTGEEREPTVGDVYLASGSAVIAHFDGGYGQDFPILRRVHTERIAEGMEELPPGYYIETGKVRSCNEGEFYLYAGKVCKAVVDHHGLDPYGSIILVPLG